MALPRQGPRPLGRGQRAGRRPCPGTGHRPCPGKGHRPCPGTGHRPCPGKGHRPGHRPCPGKGHRPGHWPCPGKGRGPSNGSKACLAWQPMLRQTGPGPAEEKVGPGLSRAQPKQKKIFFFIFTFQGSREEKIEKMPRRQDEENYCNYFHLFLWVVIRNEP